MASPEIDEAAAAKFFEVCAPGGNGEMLGNAARTALRWKARADKWDALIRPESILPLQAAKDWRERAEQLQDALRLAQWAAETWQRRAEAAEAERDSLKRQLAQSVKAR